MGYRDGHGVTVGFFDVAARGGKCQQKEKRPPRERAVRSGRDHCVNVLLLLLAVSIVVVVVVASLFILVVSFCKFAIGIL